HAGLTRALEYFIHRGKNDLRLARLYLARGRVGLRRDDPSGAAADFLAGIETFERQRPMMSDSERISFFDTATELFDEAIALAVRRGRGDEALGLAERGRGRQLLDTVPGGGSPLEIAVVRAGLPAATALVYYAVLPKETLVWVLGPGDTVMHSEPIAEEALQRLVDDLLKAIQDPVEAERCREVAGRLHDILIRPVAAALSGARTLVFVPDKSLH